MQKIFSPFASGHAKSAHPLLGNDWKTQNRLLKNGRCDNLPVKLRSILFKSVDAKEGV
jgi:hypothetical protein